MSSRNSVFYVQRQINHILKKVRHFVKTFINDIVIKSQFFDEHLTHLRSIFQIFSKINIFIKSIKVFLIYLNENLLNQKINVLKLSITNEK